MWLHDIRFVHSVCVCVCVCSIPIRCKLGKGKGRWKVKVDYVKVKCFFFSSTCNHIWTEVDGSIATVLIIYIYTQQFLKNGACGRKFLTIGESAYADCSLEFYTIWFCWCVRKWGICVHVQYMYVYIFSKLQALNLSSPKAVTSTCMVLACVQCNLIARWSVHPLNIEPTHEATFHCDYYG